MKNLLLSILVLLPGLCYSQLFKNKENGLKVSFFSEAPLENIQAASSKAVSLLNFQNDSVVVKIANTSFHFKNSLMEEHFNENYMESAKYPFSVFKGKLSSKIDYQKDGVYPVKVKGLLTIHGVRQAREIEGTIKVTNSQPSPITLHAALDVKLADHRIEIPKLLFEKIAETIRITIDGEYIPHK